MFSASPETIRREPREFDLLRSVGNLQDLAVCAFVHRVYFGSIYAAAVLRFSAGVKSSLLPIYAKQIRYYLPGYGKGRPIAISFLPFPVVDHG